MNSAKNWNLLSALVVAVLVIMACGLSGAGTVRGSGKLVEEERAVSDISGVVLATQGDLTIELGDSESFRIEAEDNLLEYFETEVYNGHLNIGTRNNIRLETTKPVRYFLTVKSLESITISSSGNIQAPDLESTSFSIIISSSGDLAMQGLEADTVRLDISSSGDVNIDELNAVTLKVNITSSGNLSIAGGQAETQSIVISSSGNYTARDLESDEATVNLSSSGSATIWVQESLKANLSSSGDLRYRGNPSVNSNTNSSGDVIQLEE